MRLLLLFALVLVGLAPAPGSSQSAPLPDRALVDGLSFEPLRFTPPEVDVHDLSGVRVFHLLDATLPLVDVFVRFKGGYGRFGIEHYAAGSALPSLLRTGGTLDADADSVDRRIEALALQMSFGGSGSAISASLNTLRSTLDEGLDLWWSMVTRPAFDSEALEVWRGRELESVLRRVDDPGRLAFSEFNRLMYGDHPIGWEMAPDDLTPDRLTPDRLLDLHRRVVCRDNLVMGVAGDVAWGDIEPRLSAMLADLPTCPDELPDTPLPDIRREPGVFLIPKAIDQSTIVMAHTTGLRQGATPDFFASRIGNSILGASGFSSRLLGRVRTEEGLAYSASSLWTTPERYDGLIGATTRTGSTTTVSAIQVILEIMREIRSAPPAEAEVDDTIDQFVNGFVFAFESAGQIVSRRMAFEAGGLPGDWLERYVDGIQAVRPADVHEAFRRHLDPEAFTILVVGDPDRFAEPLASLGLGPVTILDPDRPTSEPSGSPRSRR